MKKEKIKKMGTIVAIICSIVVVNTTPTLAYANSIANDKVNMVESATNTLSEEVMEAMDVINEGNLQAIDASTVQCMYDESSNNGFNINNEDEVIEEINGYIEESDVITHPEDIEIRLVDDKECLELDSYIVVDSLEEVVEYMEAMQIVVESDEYMAFENTGNDIARATSSTTSTTQTLSKAITPLTFANLRATITYNTSTGVISKISNRSLEISGVTLTTGMENAYTNYYFSPTKKYVKITGDYTEVSGFITSIGAIEIARNHAYVQFKYNYEKGLYDAKGGYGYSDTSF